MFSPLQTRNLRILSLTLGFTSIIAQVLLLREFSTVFYGNETSYAVILAGWLIGISFGSFVLSRLTTRIKTPGLWLGVFLILNALVLPSAIAAVRGLKSFLHIPTGQIVGVEPMLAAVFALLIPVTFLLGGFFTVLCRLAEHGEDTDEGRDVSTVYLWEGAGAGVGGLLFTVALIPFLPAMHIAVLTGLLNLTVLLIVSQRRYLFFYGLGFYLLAAVMVLSAAGWIERLDRLTRHIQWQGLQLVDSVDSRYGNITMTRLGSAFSLFQNGLLSFSSEDTVAAEENVHFAMLAHPLPRRVLLLGNGLGGALAEVLKYPQVQVDFVDLDPRVIEVSRQYLPPEVLAPLDDLRVNVFYQDARLFVKRAPGVYDVVIVNLPDPCTALLNRFYTEEFFNEVTRILRTPGLLAFRVSSSENYLNDAARDFLRSLNTTLKTAFPQVAVVPGDTNVFLAARPAGTISLDPAVFVRRLKERGILTKYVSEFYLPSRLDAWRVRELTTILSTDGRVNTDIRPVAFLYDIVLWSTHFNTGFRNLIRHLSGITFGHLLVIPAVILLAGWIAQHFAPAVPVKISIATTGFSEIIYQVIVILAFQSLYGYAYEKIGLIMAAFMIGLVFGSLTARTQIGKPRRMVARLYLLTQAGITLYPLLLPVVFVVFDNAVADRQWTAWLAAVFAALPVVAGYLGGLQYPLAVSLNQDAQSSGAVSGSAGLLYALDVLGAAIGGLAAGMVLVPIFGIARVAHFCAILNGTVLVLLLGNKMQKSPRITQLIENK